VRDKARLDQALKGIDLCIHAAAIKDLSVCEFNPFECLETNVNGTRNVIEACIKNNVARCIFISTDKAVKPINIYGISKAMAEKLWVHGNTYSAGKWPIFQVCRYGNVILSAGSVIEVWQRAAAQGKKIELRNENMTRFFMTMSEALATIKDAFDNPSRLLTLPKNIKAVKLTDLAQALGLKYEITEALPGEKLHEVLSEDMLTSEFWPKLAVSKISHMIKEEGDSWYAKV
jgi:UDP-N-acetylglucosamine 4,6-dehydratase